MFPKEQEWLRREDELAEELMVLLGEEYDDVIAMIESGQIDLEGYWAKRKNKWVDTLGKAAKGAFVASVLFDLVRLFGGSDPPDYREQMQLDALAYVADYVQRTAGDITGTSGEVVTSLVAELALGEIDLAELKERLVEAGFSEARARTIAVTENTRAMFHGEEKTREFLRSQGFEVVAVWYTANDDQVCELCGPLHGTYEDGPGRGWGGRGYTPANTHIGCRCRTRTIVL